MTGVAADERRILARLAHPEARLCPHGRGYAVFPRGDRRRRPLAFADGHLVSALLADGAIAPAEDGAYAATRPGAKRAARLPSDDDGFRAQHDPQPVRVVGEGVQHARRAEAYPALTRLKRLQSADGGAFFSDAEWRAACVLCELWARTQIGLYPQVDWSRAGGADGPRMVDAPFEIAVAARRTLEGHLAKVTPTMAAIVRDVLFEEAGLEAVEASRGWPPRSAKVVLKAALEAIAAGRG